MFEEGKKSHLQTDLMSADYNKTPSADIFFSFDILLLWDLFISISIVFLWYTILT